MPVGGLDNEVEMVVEDRVVDETEAEAIAAGEERCAEGRVGGPPAQRREAAPQPQSDVTGEARRELRSRRVRDAGDGAGGLAAGPRAGASMPLELQLTLSTTTTCHVLIQH
jgi:hypothetical protein